jgi:hypothetical protein
MSMWVTAAIAKESMTKPLRREKSKALLYALQWWRSEDPDGADLMGESGVEAVRIIAELAVAAGTLALAGFTWWLARGTSILAREAHASSQAADRLFDLQRQDMEQRERTARPNLQIVDVREGTRDGRVAQLSDRELWADIGNFGNRPARIVSMTLHVEGMKDRYAEQRSRPVLHAGETLRITIGGAFTLGVSAAMHRAKAVDNAVISGALPPETGDAYEPNFQGRLSITYTEIDGSNESEVIRDVDLMAYRGIWAHSDFTYEVKSSGTSPTPYDGIPKN